MNYRIAIEVTVDSVRPEGNNYMEDKKYFYIAGIVVVVLLLIGIIGGFLYYQFGRIQGPVTMEPVFDTNTSTYPTLPVATSTGSGNGLSPEEQARVLEKEKQFISSYFQNPTVTYFPSAKAYTLPLKDVKEQAVNYRDFSRRINLDKSLAPINNHGFTVIANPFDAGITDWQTSYQTLLQNKLPILITSDSLLGVYQQTLAITYKEAEDTIFYDSLWQVLRQVYDQSRRRYETGFQQAGIEADAATEASRLELAYAAVGLKLLEPQANQIKEAIGEPRIYFSTQESQQYRIVIPSYLQKEVDAELALIAKLSKSAPSPIFKDTRDYQIFTVPVEYAASEKLKNYYRASAWLTQTLFPLYAKGDQCPDCTFDAPDHQVTFLTALYLSRDLAASQDLKNRWANIYKSVSYFRGLEYNLTYLDYDRALRDSFGDTYNLDELFTQNDETTKKNIATVQKKLAEQDFIFALSGTDQSVQNKGLRLMRQRYLMEQKLFSQVVGTSVGTFTGPTEKVATPFTGCPQNKTFERCISTSLDLFAALGNPLAKQWLDTTSNNRYQQYGARSNAFASSLSTFSPDTWRDNTYLNTLQSLSLLKKSPTGFPAFMQTDQWAAKTLDTSLGAWTDFHRTIVIDRVKPEDTVGLVSYFPYGYVEPQPELYARLSANVDMTLRGLAQLQIIAPQSKSYERLSNLKTTLDRAYDISVKELSNIELNGEDYDYINGFYKNIRQINGDVKKANLANKVTINYPGTRNTTLRTQINGLNYVVALYPDSQGKLFLAIGPMLNYSEAKNNIIFSNNWQSLFKTK